MRAEYQKKYYKEWLLKHPTSARARKLKHYYNITSEDYNKMLLMQEYRCALCMKHQDELKLALGIDHNHDCCPGDKSCGKCIRGLLCNPCNVDLGRYEILIRQAAKFNTYLKVRGY